MDDLSDRVFIRDKDHDIRVFGSIELTFEEFIIIYCEIGGNMSSIFEEILKSIDLIGKLSDFIHITGKVI